MRKLNIYIKVEWGAKAILYIMVAIATSSCNSGRKQQPPAIAPQLRADTITEIDVPQPDTIIVDSRYTFEEAIAGTRAPEHIIAQLELIDVTYRSTDGRLHSGQLLLNRRIADDIREMFDFMLQHNFVIEKAIPIVTYGWNDSLSMDDNNTSAFCYRNVSYSRHAQGMAIDINPRFNPLRWKHIDRPNMPIGAVSDTTVNGTLHPDHAVVQEFRRRGFRWGHTFSKYYDDHHFERGE